MRLESTLHRPNRKIMDMLFAEDYLKLQFNSRENPDDDILIFHNSKDEYAHNGDIRITCFLRTSTKVLAYVRKNKKVKALIKKIKKYKGEEK